MNGPSAFGLGAKLTASIAVITFVTLALVFTSVFVLNGQKDDSTVVNIAGRQRMLSQKMSKEALSIAAGLEVSSNRDSLKQTADLFASSLNSLINGDEKLNLPPTQNPQILSQMRQVEVLWDNFSPHIDTFVNPASTEAARSVAAEYILQNNVPLLKEMNSAVGMYEKHSRGKVGTLKTVLYAGGLIALIVTLLCWLAINRKVVRPVRDVVEMVKGMEQGNLDKRLDMKQNDEIGQLATAMDLFAENLKSEILTAFNRLATGDFTFQAKGLIAKPLSEANQKLSETIKAVQSVSHKVAADSLQVATTSTELADGATQQAAALEEISASMTEMNEQTENNTRNASQVSTLSAQAKQSAERGNDQMQSMVKAMSEIKESGDNISRIIKVIDEIAFQTNLLALNAAVEAARAGQHGKGFAVVAEEVRNLAARSAKAASETTDLINSSVEKTENGSQIADQTAKALSEIYDGVVKVSGLVDEIAAASNEQAQGIAQANEGLNQLDSVNQNSTAIAEETASISEELSGQTNYLQKMLSCFSITGGTVDVAAPKMPESNRTSQAPPKGVQNEHQAIGWGGMS
ncbi:methyl-accepting chemotaxis protein [Malonomonas rubra DSM 5091]|uniref:Methyl-accepting chemotaxis protein n=1 Tax=Malonomonas rubra DSM 5091 TaxID=1122189 RepID=A0A1M6KZ10_MALRU|nr:methyl-accepting chemotaxis protein [Malonomonas rubra]SHJ64197.1 methyl-accepting chemotaxis protein [Malonomonas rubra DSM 5091]